MVEMKRLLLGTILVVGIVLYMGGPVQAQGIIKLSPETIAEFDAYVKDGERLLQKRIDGDRPFLWADDLPERRLTLRRGDILVEGLPETPEISDGLLHVWLGAMFVPEATGPEVLAVLQNYDRHQEWYPEPVESKLLSQDGDVYRGYLKLRRKKVITVVLSTSMKLSIPRCLTTVGMGGPTVPRSPRWRTGIPPRRKSSPWGRTMGICGVCMLTGLSRRPKTEYLWRAFRFPCPARSPSAWVGW